MGKSSNPFKSIERSIKSVDKFISKAAKQTKQNLKNFGDDINWTGVVRPALIGIGAGMLTGGIAGMATGAGFAAGATGATALTLGATGAYQNIEKEKIKKENAEAQAEYQVQVDKANNQALENRRAELLSLRKQLTKNYSKSFQGGGGASIESANLLGGTKLG